MQKITVWGGKEEQSIKNNKGGLSKKKSGGMAAEGAAKKDQWERPGKKFEALCKTNPKKVRSKNMLSFLSLSPRNPVGLDLCVFFHSYLSSAALISTHNQALIGKE